MDCADIAVAILAAGRARRFGSDKLMEPVNNVPLGLHIAHSLGAMGFGWRFAICGAGGLLAGLYADLDFTVIDNENPDWGQSQSLYLAVGAAQSTPAAALLIVLADMPFVTQGHLKAIAATGRLTASTDGAARMPPILFPRALWPELLAAKGDSGARHLLRDAHLVQAPVLELHDIDVVEDLPRPRLI
jgi:molybdenum cofactor cytidylyltransferase